ncbi:SGNH/GDSL hydrolase family protein [Amycolatopsis sp. FDAARGOS 1241]|uniref:SGNH/GDSL hydrolase family protein n=1 Tax=Amycolatopsis sp. FDAARGOS 1241 TaxID=2778070 RepID=UPI0019500309|nr:SGNH/GDSL hydrolase family protein [Amycolatopsis sp. FDAARGOS 1241]QRP42789.1 SGNH/GDSL hydrolase family protein [Amycolatopsis sp. FDAARGOS 1241]
MKKWWLVPAMFAALVSFAGTASACPQPEYYLSLGDSLAVGFQPDATGVGHPTDQGFDQLVAQRRELGLTELGCPGETTTSMLVGGSCHGATSQVSAAERFLAAHRGHTRLVTLVIGATDVEDCATATGIDLACVGQGIAAVQKNLPVIVSRVHRADPRAKIVGLNLYDPFLVSFLQGPAGQDLARQSVQLLQQVNAVLGGIYSQAGVPVADVESAFHTTDFTPASAPLNVTTICADTFMCAPAPVGPNIHPNAAGYGLLADAVQARLHA